MFVLASPIVDWSAMWKICLVALAAGAGVVIVFGFLLLGLKIADSPATGGGGAQGAGSRFTGYALSAVCGVIVIGVIVVGIYAMTQKPSSKPTKTKSAAVTTAPARQHQLVA
jgi:hypothetical protein